MNCPIALFEIFWQMALLRWHYKVQKHFIFGGFVFEPHLKLCVGMRKPVAWVDHTCLYCELGRVRNHKVLQPVQGNQSWGFYQMQIGRFCGPQNATFEDLNAFIVLLVP